MIPSVRSEFNTAAANHGGFGGQVGCAWRCPTLISRRKPGLSKAGLSRPCALGPEPEKTTEQPGSLDVALGGARAAKAATTDICMCACSQGTGMCPRLTLSSLSPAIHGGKRQRNREGETESKTAWGKRTEPGAA